MNGYQPKETCNNCRAFNVCKKSKDGKDACNAYCRCSPPPPLPKSGSLAITPQGFTYTPPQKHRTVLSVRDFAILYNMVNHTIFKMESQAQDVWSGWCNREATEEEIEERKAKNMEHLRQNIEYQDLLRIRDKLGTLNIEIETPSVEVER